MTDINRSDNGDSLQEWAAAWQAAPARVASVSDIRRYVEVRGRRLRWWVAGELLVAAVALPVVLYIATTTSEVIERSAMLGLAAITVASVGFSLWNWRSMLRSSAWTTTAYLEFASRMVRRKRLALRAAWVVLGAEVSVFIVWIWDHFHARARIEQGPNAEVFAWSWLGGMTVAAIVVLVVTGRLAARDAAKFRTISRELGD